MFTIGTDPEFFIYDTKLQKIISAVGILPGTKDNVYKPEELPDGFGLQVDNVLGEFNIPPCSSKREFVSNIKKMKTWISRYLKKINPNYTMLYQASAILDDDQLLTPESKEFGCSIDYDVYEEAPNPKPDGEITNLRSAGFHVHVGVPNYSTAKKLIAIKHLDGLLGLKSILLDPDDQRRKLYGKAGCFRLTPYGFEYRTLSAYFLQDEYLDWIYNAVEIAIYKTDYEQDYRYAPKIVQNIINTNNKLQAIKLL